MSRFLSVSVSPSVSFSACFCISVFVCFSLSFCLFLPPPSPPPSLSLLHARPLSLSLRCPTSTHSRRINQHKRSERGRHRSSQSFIHRFLSLPSHCRHLAQSVTIQTRSHALQGEDEVVPSSSGSPVAELEGICLFLLLLLLLLFSKRQAMLTSFAHLRGRGWGWGVGGLPAELRVSVRHFPCIACSLSLTHSLHHLIWLDQQASVRHRTDPFFLLSFPLS